MPESLSLAAVELAGREIPLGDALRRVHQRSKLLPLLREAAVEELCRAEAETLGLKVSNEELQQRADRFRRRKGLDSAEKTNAWLAGQRLSAHDFEAALERDLLIEKLKEQLTKDAIPGHFEQNKAAFDRVRMRQMVVAREDLAAELRSQIEEDGKNFAELARRHARSGLPAETGVVIEIFRRQLPEDLAEAIFSARPGDVVGPLATRHGFLLALVEEVHPAELAAITAKVIRQELFDKWLQEKLKKADIRFPLLDAL